MVSGRQQRLVRIGEWIVRSFHAQRSQKSVAYVLIEWLSRDLFDQVAGNRISGIRIRHACSGRPARNLRFLKSLENIKKREVISIAQVVNFAEFHVVEARRV